MSDFREGLHLVPEHMRSSVVQWLEHGNPHPRGMGEFFRRLVTGAPWHEVIVYADDMNRRSLVQWHKFFYNFAPSTSYGSEANAEAWWRAHHAEVDPADSPVGGQ